MIVVYRSRVGSDISHAEVSFICDSYGELSKYVTEEENAKRKTLGIDVKVLPEDIILSPNQIINSEFRYIFINHRLEKFLPDLQESLTKASVLYGTEIFGMFREIDTAEYRSNVETTIEELKKIRTMVYQYQIRHKTAPYSCASDPIIGYAASIKVAESLKKTIGSGAYYEKNPLYSPAAVSKLGHIAKSLMHDYQYLDELEGSR